MRITGRSKTHATDQQGAGHDPPGDPERLGLLPHSEVEFDVVGDSVRIRKARGKRSRWQMMVDRLRGSVPKEGLNTDQIMAMTRGED